MAADKRQTKGSTKVVKTERKTSKAQSDKPSKAKVSKKTGTKKSQKNVMLQYANARLSDVSDKVFVASSELHGKGLFAAKRIKADTVLGRLVGMPTVDDGIYVLWITEEIGLELVNDFKFINHGKNPNAAYTDLDVTILRDVEAGEELLHDYGW